MADAGFMDAEPGPLMLRAESAEDLTVISALSQDAVIPVAEIAYDPRARQIAFLINRFRWEDADAAEREGRPFERVRALLVFRDVLSVKSDGIDRNDRELVLSLLSIGFQPGEDGAGVALLHFAGDGVMALSVECLDADLRDVSRPYIAPSRLRPGHPD
ncbi:MAG: DUF2948 family protein [Paracoccus sp. (in: a-proteobacteria)]|nr:DUF2948 family protein [Paracoccus sp. (in: a-proteobacteria)]